MDGNTDLLSKEVRKVLSDKGQIETARQQFLANPDMAELMGLSMDVVEDPLLWAKAMEQGADAILAQTMGTGGSGSVGGGFDGLFQEEIIDDEEVVVESRSKQRRSGKLSRAA